MSTTMIHRHILTAILLMGFSSSLFAEHSDHRNRKIDSMEVVLQQKDLPWRDRLRAHSELMWGYLQTDGKKSIHHAKEIIRQTAKTKDEGLLVRANAFRLLGQHAYAIGLNDSARHCYDRALETVRQMEKSNAYTHDDIDNTYAALYGTIGNLYNIQGMLELAVDYYYKALPYMERQNWQEGISTLYYNVGEMYLEMGNNQEARKAYVKALDAANSTGDSLILVAPRHGLATILLNEGKPNEALTMELANQQYLRDHADEELGGLMDNLVLQARIYWEGLDDKVKAQQMLDEALLIADRLPNTAQTSDAYFVQGRLCMARNQWQQGAEWCLRALKNNDEDPHHNILVWQALAEAYAHLERAEEAVSYQTLMHDALVQLATERHQAAISEARIRYETEKKEAQIALLGERQRATWWMVGLIFIVLIVAFTAYVFINRQRHKTKVVEERLDSETNERRRLARDLHDQVGGLLVATRHNLEQGHTGDAMTTLSEATARLRCVAHHLMPDSLRRFGLVTALNDYCQVLHGVSFTCLGTPRRLSAKQEELCYATIHELINNALRHAQASHIQVQMMFDEESLSVVIADDGCGFDIKAVLDDERHADGTGIRSIRNRIRAAGGDFSITSESGQGTEALFTVKTKN